uniref:Transferrin receptor 1b n=1 Tax=Salarias fasciatus TaxID=181472 RepID=A0A672GD24_SALFA
MLSHCLLTSLSYRVQIKSERYSRFTLQPTEDGERHAEVKLSDDATEAEAGGSPTFRPAPARYSRRTVLYMVLGVLLIFLAGGFHTGRQSDICRAVFSEALVRKVQKPNLSLSSECLCLSRMFDVPSRAAGSAEDMHLADHIFKAFSDLHMDPWTDIHYVQLPARDGSVQRPNLVQFGSEVFKPAGYLAYSAAGRAQGKLVYGNYGRKEDLQAVQSRNVALRDSVVLLRAGKISFAEQVNNAASMGAVAVLIYPDSQDFAYRQDTPLYGHVHLGSGDPYTPGFPSFNHTQFPPTKSAGLPQIPAQTITANTASALLSKMGGPGSDASFKGALSSVPYTLGGVENATVEVNNVLVNKEIHNVFGVVKGFTDPDQYVVLGAQRDAWGPGSAKASVVSSVLMGSPRPSTTWWPKGFRPRRSVVFASFSAGEFGSVGATEWLEVRTFLLTQGRGSFIASASPLLYSLLENILEPPIFFFFNVQTEADDVGRPCLSLPGFSGIPSISFHFISKDYYSYFGTKLDSMDHLAYETSHRIGEMTAAAAQLAGRMALRLVHDHLLMFDVRRYGGLLTKSVSRVYIRVNQLTQVIEVKRSFNRAADSIQNDIVNSDLTDREACRLINDRLMMVTKFNPPPLPSVAATEDMAELHTQLALATWNLQGCANAMVGNIWDLDNQI